MNCEQRRCLALARELIERFNLNLEGLQVLTECASGAYAFTAVLARLAKAEVHAVGRDSHFATHQENADNLRTLLRLLDLESQCHIYEGRVPEPVWANCDIITNTGFVRPIGADRLRLMKATAVIPLMFESWEFRPEDLDLESARKLGIAVLATDERNHLDMFGYLGFMALKLLFELGLDVHQTRLALLGGHRTGESIAATFEALDLPFEWFTPTGQERSHNCHPYSELSRLEKLPLEAVVCAEHQDRRLLAGPEAPVSFTRLSQTNPQLRWGHISGNIDSAELLASGLKFHPQDIRNPGYLSYGATELGPKPVLELHAAGLKVAELGARARQAGASVEQATQACVASGFGQALL